MLRHLHIQNYALISQLDIDFGEGFSVLTGETGSGKSIILGALALVMGGRADTKTITEGEERCIIEAEFDHYIIRRELNINGRSRSFVNDEVATQAELKALAAQLIDIHSQHANLLIANDDFQLSIVDAIAHNQLERDTYAQHYARYRQTEKELRDLRDLAAKTSKDQDYLSFQFKQLEEAALNDPNELRVLEEEEYALSHVEERKQQLLAALQALDNDESCALSLIHDANGQIRDISDVGERLHSLEIELKDIIHDVERLSEQTEYDPERMQVVQERLDLINTLLRKHQVSTIDELMTLRDQWAEQLTRIANFDEDIAALEQQLAQDRSQLQQSAQTLRQSREKVRSSICQQLIANLCQLGIVHANVDIEISDLDDYTETGKDNVQFLFAANLNQSLRRVSEVASGGEISRFMLCVKALIAATNGLPTIIFDEIDTGVSGEVAAQMGQIIQEMATSRQIIAITHLPQIAAQAQTQYLVYKQDEQDRTQTHIKQLTIQERQQYLDQFYATVSRAFTSKNAQ
ncbi:MAG: DNA repair protein RecN [Paludibacteraceae bacterium]|nr:DNA repair protein RecN [Paludibacteraceae bacterium]